MTERSGESCFEVNTLGETRIAQAPFSCLLHETQQNPCLVARELVSGGEGKLRRGRVYSA